jgi:hypothetical protein
LKITASTGKPYTLHLDLPEPPATDISTKAANPPPNILLNSPILNTADAEGITKDNEPRAKNNELIAAQVKWRRLERERKTIEDMYCPCPGFAYNSLAGDRNILASFPFSFVHGRAYE